MRPRLLRTTLLILLLVFVIAVGGILTLLFPSRYDNLPELETGDLIFQTLPSPFAPAIAASTNSLLTHVGIIMVTDDGPVVMDSAGVIRNWTLDTFVQRGLGNKFRIYRHKDMTPEKQEALLTALQPYYGRHYDIFFLFGNPELYCSELVWEAFNAIGLSAGTIERLGDLDTDNYVTQTTIKRIAPFHPYCRENINMSQEACISKIMEQELVSPVSITRDPNYTQIYNNYPFASWLN
ncbi:MAG: hypothetical protein H6908_01885 [Hyphomicrobiales bacterium]|nr:hypothetical protein [Rickettsiales bacterium]MCP5361383.1 hypothetical protein [Hyphomicrobiales bacterium]